MRKHIPNILTCCNLISGCISMVMALRGHLEIASLLIFVSAFFDFLDGFAARMLKVKSDIGVDMDSLADIVSFGVAPAMILFIWMEHSLENLAPVLESHAFIKLLPYFAFIIPAFSALRLAHFNHDDRQHTEFIGLPTPANALFIGFLHFSADELPFVSNFWLLLALTFVFSILLVSNIPMFSLKFKHLGIRGNEIKYSFLLVSLILLIMFKLGAFPVIILTYILISLIKFTISKII